MWAQIADTYVDLTGEAAELVDVFLPGADPVFTM
jgi:hypothetical protein